MDVLDDLAAKAAAGQAFTPHDAARLLACRDLVRVGTLGEAGRRARWGDRVSYGRVRVVTGGVLPPERGDAGEVRVAGTPSSADEAVAWVRNAVTFAGGVPLTGFSLADLLNLTGGDHLALASLAA